MPGIGLPTVPARGLAGRGVGDDRVGLGHAEGLGDHHPEAEPGGQEVLADRGRAGQAEDRLVETDRLAQLAVDDPLEQPVLQREQEPGSRCSSIATPRWRATSTARRPRTFLSPDSPWSLVTIAEWNFSHTRGTARKLSGRTSRQDLGHLGEVAHEAGATDGVLRGVEARRSAPRCGRAAGRRCRGRRRAGGRRRRPGRGRAAWRGAGCRPSRPGCPGTSRTLNSRPPWVRIAPLGGPVVPGGVDDRGGVVAVELDRRSRPGHRGPRPAAPCRGRAAPRTSSPRRPRRPRPR